MALPEGFGYVSVVLDAFSRKALGWEVSGRIDTALPVAAIQSVFRDHPLEDGWIHHSDRGCHHTSGEYRALVLERGGTLSNSRKGNPYDNARMESLFKTYKAEEAHLSVYDSLEALEKGLREFLGEYNSQAALQTRIPQPRRVRSTIRNAEIPVCPVKGAQSSPLLKAQPAIRAHHLVKELSWLFLVHGKPKKIRSGQRSRVQIEEASEAP